MDWEYIIDGLRLDGVDERLISSGWRINGEWKLNGCRMDGVNGE